MASAPKISIRLGLDGKNEIMSGIDEVTSHGLAKFNELKNTAGSAMADGGKKVNEQLKQLGLHSIESKRGIDQFREALHIAHPVLDAAGLGVGNLGAISRLASVGIEGFFAAIAAAAVVGLARLGEQEKKTRATFDAIYGPKEAPKAEERIKQQARELGTSPEALLAPTAAIRDTNALLGRPSSPTDQRAEKEQAALNELIRTGGANQEEAAKATNDFFAAFRKQALEHPKVTPKLTAEMLDALPRPAGNELSQMFGAGPDVTRLLRQLQGGREISFDDITRRFDLRGPAIHKGFTELPPEKRKASEAFTGAVEAGKVTGGEIGAPLDTAGVLLSDALKHEISRNARPGGPPSFGASLAHVAGSLVLGPLASQFGVPGKVDALSDFVAASERARENFSQGATLPEPAPLPFAAALGAHSPGGAGARVNAAQLPSLPQPPGLAALNGPQPGLTQFLNAIAAPFAPSLTTPNAGMLPPGPPIAFPPQPPGLTQFLSATSVPLAAPLSIPTAALSASTAQLSPTISSLNSLLSSLAGAISGAVQRISSTPAPSAAGAQTGATEQTAPAAPGQALGGIIGLSGGGSPLAAMDTFRLPSYAKGGHVLARVSAGEHFFPPKEVAAIGLPTLHAMNGLKGGGRIHGPGTGTSDSIPALLPRGGFVLNAGAAASIGEHALNHLHAMAEGGHVDFSGVHGSSAPVPALGRDAGGGGGEFHLHWPDGSSTKMPMARDVLDELSQKSALYRLASGGVRSSAQS
jgi:hypothetical protein